MRQWLMDVAGRVRALGRAARRGLLDMVAGRDQPVRWPADRLGWLRWLCWILVPVATVILVPVTLATVVAGHDVSIGVATAVAAAEIAPLPLVLRHPLLGWRIGLVTALVTPWLWPTSAWGTWAWDPVQVPVLAVVFVVSGLRRGWATLWWMFALMAGTLWLHTADELGNVAGGGMLLLVVTVTVGSISGRLRAQRALEAEAERTEVEKARRAVLEERARIARELHDVVAHHMSLIAVQAETAAYRRDDVSAGAAEELASISGQARTALREMRRLLGVLRSEKPSPRAPQPRLSDLDALAEGLRRAGARVRMTVLAAGDPPLEPVQVCVYRVMQEALSNATRHAPGAEVEAMVEVAASEVRIRVRNSPGAATRHPGDRSGHSGGHGLLGMRERVVSLGGRLSTGGTSDGGFAVSAVIPTDTPVDETTV